jgi:hypothetical protein
MYLYVRLAIILRIFFCLTLLSAIFSCSQKSLKQYLFFLCNFYLAKVCRKKLQIGNSILKILFPWCWLIMIIDKWSFLQLTWHFLLDAKSIPSNIVQLFTLWQKSHRRKLSGHNLQMHKCKFFAINWTITLEALKFIVNKWKYVVVSLCDFLLSERK